MGHPMQHLIGMFVTTDEDDEDGVYTTFDIDSLAEFVGMDDEDLDKDC